MIITVGYSVGINPPAALGMGSAWMLVSGSGAQDGPLVGIWQNVTYLEARQPTTELNAASERLTLQARADNANN